MGLGVKLYQTHHGHDHGCGDPHAHELLAGGEEGPAFPIVDGCVLPPGHTIRRKVPARMPDPSKRPTVD